MAEIGDPVAVTTLERQYWSYARFCLQRSIRPAAFEAWLLAQRRGWNSMKYKAVSDSVAQRERADNRTIREVLLP
jgi:hypothetical protein